MFRYTIHIQNYVNFTITVTAMRVKQSIKNINFQLEALLLFVPAIIFFGLLVIYKLFSIDPYFSVSIPFLLGNNIIIMQLGLFIVPYILHRFLRSRQQGAYTFRVIHVMLSVFLLFAIMFTYQVVRPTYANYVTPIFDNKNDTKFWMEATMATYIILGAQIVVQIIFLMYSLNIIFPPKPKDPVVELSV